MCHQDSEKQAGMWTAGSFCPALPRLTSQRQQWANSADRRLPLSDYNLWSISVIGGVCRDSYSNNYVDQTVSKATNPTPYNPAHKQSGYVFLLAIVKKSLTLSLETAFVKFVYEIIACYVQLFPHNEKKRLWLFNF